jgi:hypothetical protein
MSLNSQAAPHPNNFAITVCGHTLPHKSTQYRINKRAHMKFNNPSSIKAMSICVFDPEMTTTPVEKSVFKHSNFLSSDDSSSSTAPLTPQSPSAESREDQPQTGSSWNKYHHNRRRFRNKPRNYGPRNTEMRPYHSPTHVSPPHDRPMTKNDIYFALDCEVRPIVM